MTMCSVVRHSSPAKNIWGNLLAISGIQPDYNGCTQENLNVIATTNNQISGDSYDAAGNLLSGPGMGPLTYDAENRVVTSSGSSYTYDGNSLRVKKISGGTTTVYVFSSAKVIAEYVNSSLSKEYIYSGSALLATITATTTTYHHADHLSVRLTTDTNGNLAGQQGHCPYGESWYAVSTTTKWQFTSYERDTESGNDYAIFRYHVNRLGRFNSPDPLPGSLANPQSFNRYAYARNDPSNLTDPSGLATSFWEWFFSAENSNSFGGGPGILLAAEDYSLRESFGDRYYDLPSLFPRAAEQAEAEHTKRVTEAFLRQSLREVFKKHPECADLLGGERNAIALLNKMTILNVLDPIVFPPSAADPKSPFSGVLSGDLAAETEWKTLRNRWNGRAFTIFIGQSLLGASGPQMLTILIHELRHVALNQSGPNAAIDNPVQADYEKISRVCDTGGINTAGG